MRNQSRETGTLSAIFTPFPTPSLLPASSVRLLRSEYYEVEQAAISANDHGKDIFVVTGHPGIGSSAVPTLSPTESIMTLDWESLSSWAARVSPPLSISNRTFGTSLTVAGSVGGGGESLPLR